MEQVASILEKRISSLNTATSRRRDDAAGEGTSARLLKSGSLDSMMGGIRSPGSATPDLREEWAPPEIVADLTIQPGIPEQGTQMASSPFAEAAQQPLEETVVVTPNRIYHGLTRPEKPRGMPRGDNSDRPDPAVKWKGYRTLLLFWLSAGIVTFLSSLFWLQAGMWAGAIGIIGSSLSLSGCYSQRRLILDVHVTRIFAVASSGLASFTAVLFLFLLIRLHCPRSVRSEGYCGVFRLGMVMTVLWFAFYASVAVLVSVGATRVIALIEPVGLRRVVVLRPPGIRQGTHRTRSSSHATSSHSRHQV